MAILLGGKQQRVDTNKKAPGSRIRSIESRFSSIWKCPGRKCCFFCMIIYELAAFLWVWRAEEEVFDCILVCNTTVKRFWFSDNGLPYLEKRNFRISCLFTLGTEKCVSKQWVFNSILILFSCSSTLKISTKQLTVLTKVFIQILISFCTTYQNSLWVVIDTK